MIRGEGGYNKSPICEFVCGGTLCHGLDYLHYGVGVGSKGGDVRHDHDLESGIHGLGRGEHQMQLTTGICRLIDRHDIERTLAQ